MEIYLHFFITNKCSLIHTEEDGGHKNDKPNKTEEEHIQDDAHRIGKNNQSEAKLGK